MLLRYPLRGAYVPRVMVARAREGVLAQTDHRQTQATHTLVTGAAESPTLGRVCELSGQSAWIEAEAAVEEAVRLLERQPELSGLLVFDKDGGYRGVLPRVKLFHALSKAFVKDLFYRRAVSVFMADQIGEKTLELPVDQPIDDAINQALSRVPTERYEPLVVLHPSGERELLDVRALIDGQRRLLEAVLNEVERQRVEARHAATHDRLTGLANRLLIQERLQDTLRQSGKLGRETVVMFLDFDRFKVINDSLGHDAGDELLKQIARRLLATVGEVCGNGPESGQWTVGRLGGDEFLIVLLENEAGSRTERASEAILQAMSVPFTLLGQEASSTPSIGITNTASSGTDPSALMRDADAAMYRAKAQGRNRAVRFDRSMHEESTARLEIENQLRRALNEKQVVPHYQPIVSCSDGSLVGFEALARWEHVIHGAISPGVFVPIAEETGLIAKMSEQVAEHAIAQLAAWREMPGGERITMSINISKRHMLMPGFYDSIADTIAGTTYPRNASTWRSRRPSPWTAAG